MIKVAIVDDEQTICDKIKNILLKFDDIDIKNKKKGDKNMKKIKESEIKIYVLKYSENELNTNIKLKP